MVLQDAVGTSVLGAFTGPALLSQQLGGLPQAVMAAQAPGVITGRHTGQLKCSSVHNHSIAIKVWQVCKRMINDLGDFQIFKRILQPLAFVICPKKG